jgi:hypothetical protein
MHTHVCTHATLSAEELTPVSSHYAIYINVCVYLYVCMYVCMYVCILIKKIYIYIQNEKRKLSFSLSLSLCCARARARSLSLFQVWGVEGLTKAYTRCVCAVFSHTHCLSLAHSLALSLSLSHTHTHAGPRILDQFVRSTQTLHQSNLRRARGELTCAIIFVSLFIFSYFLFCSTLENTFFFCAL